MCRIKYFSGDWFANLLIFGELRKQIENLFFPQRAYIENTYIYYKDFSEKKIYLCLKFITDD